MNENESTHKYQSFWSIFKQTWRENRRSVFRFALFGAIIQVTVLFLLGFGYFFITLGLYWVARTLFIYWAPARVRILEIIKAEIPPNLKQQIPITPLRWIAIAPRLILSGFALYLGMRILLTSSFCTQNLLFC